jgi:hypothetical protein
MWTKIKELLWKSDKPAETTNWNRRFVWEDSELKHVAPFPRDLWKFILSFIHERRVLLRCIRVHPLFFAIVRDDATLRRLASTACFHRALCSADVSLENDVRMARLARSATYRGASDARGLEHGIGVVANTAGVNGQHVSFRLRSSFLTENYVSYFNFQILANVRGTLMTTMLYFVDGDVWDVAYNRAKREAAKWKENDVLSVDVSLRNASDFPVSWIESKFQNQAQHVSSTPQAALKNVPPAAVVSKAEYQKGSRIFVTWLLNGRTVHDPIVIQTGAEVPVYIGCKFVEFNDCVEIVDDPQLSF